MEGLDIMWRVLILFKPSMKLRNLLDADDAFEYRFVKLSGVEDSELKTLLKDPDALIVSPSQSIERWMIESAERLKVLIIHGSGYDKVDVDAASERNILVMNTPDAIADAVAEHALGLTIALLRKIVLGDRFVRSGWWSRGPSYNSFVGCSISGKRVGIVGLGRVGSSVARLFKCVGADVIYWSRRRRPEVEHALRIRYMSLEKLLNSSDILVISLALTPETRGFIDMDKIGMMKDGCIIVNVSRGGVIDEEALIKGLESGKIGGAALDVFSVEPLSNDSVLTRMDNTVLTPHIAGFTEEAMEETTINVYDLLRKIFVEKVVPMANIVNPEVVDRLWFK